MALSNEEVNKLKSSLGESRKLEAIVEDPVELPPDFEIIKGKVTESMAEEMCDRWPEESTYELADEFGVSQHCVRYHLEGKADYSHTHVTPRMCAVMREMARDGKSIRDLSERFDCNTSTVHNHVSTNGDGCNCDTNVPRVNYE